MTIKEVRKKYIGLQTDCKTYKTELSQLGDYACLFYCLCSIVDEYNFTHQGKPIDLIESFIKCKKKKLIGDECYILDGCKILELLTGVKWTRNIVLTLPYHIPESMYTVEKWFREETGYTHFKRRWGDTLVDSQTVKYGHIKEYYCYSYAA